jgi:adenylate kinase family enzyme
MVSGDNWIIDGNYDSTMEIRYSAADLVIFLDISRVVCAVSAMKRTRKKRSDLPDYLEEPNIFGKEFIEFLKWIWSYPKTGRKTVLRLHDKYPDKTYMHIKTRREASKLAKVWRTVRQERATHT